MAESQTQTPTLLSWPAGPESVQVSGDWDGWKEKVSLDKQADGSFSKKVPLPSNTKVHYKYIVDGNWTTNSSSPVVDDAGNQNNVVEVGPAPTGAEFLTAKAGEIGAGVAAGAAGLAAAATTAAHHFTDNVNGTSESTQAVEAPQKTLTTEEKKNDPASGIRDAADGDIRNQIPTSVTDASHAALPVLASAVATVTGADILRGNPESLPVSQKEINETQAQAMKGDNAFVGSKIEPQGGAISDPQAATTENAKAAATVANNATTGAPAVPVTNNGFAANITGQTGNWTTAADQDKQGGEKAGAVAAASAGAVGAAAAAGGIGAASAVNKKETTPKPVDSNSTAGTAPVPATAAPTTTTAAATDAPPAPSEPLTTGVPAASDKSLPSTGPASSKAQADKANAPAAASSGPLAAGKETKLPAPLDSSSKNSSKATKTTPAAAATAVVSAGAAKGPATSSTVKKAPTTSSTAAKKDPAPAPTLGGKDLPTTPTKKSSTKSSTIGKGDTVRGHNLGSESKSLSTGHATSSNRASEASSVPSTPDKKKKGGLLGKIKQALSPHSSPSK